MQFEHERPGLGYRGSVGSRARGIFLKVMAILLGAALVVGAVVISVVFIAVAFAIALVVGGYFWWRTRHLRKQMRQRFQQGDVRFQQGDVIEGTVLKSE